ncbi:Rrf2 family transcriptional regulator [Novosphingobium sp.]|uniref:RrF2 family transcriptional regulator n=1 Tax=Novosphingobium sp. TaxID=1874826 RepID=UPI0035B2F7D4
MQLTRHTDYALRLLIHLAHAGDRRVQVDDVARAHDISLAHLKKVANHLAHLGLVETTRGRGGGLRLARPASEIDLAEIVTGTEPPGSLVQCAGCGLIGAGCSLPSVFAEAMAAFRAVLQRHSLAEFITAPERFAGLLPVR